MRLERVFQQKTYLAHEFYTLPQNATISWLNRPMVVDLYEKVFARAELND